MNTIFPGCSLDVLSPGTTFCTFFATGLRPLKPVASSRMLTVTELVDQPVTDLLAKWRSGDRRALESLLPVVYAELRQIARRHLRRERPNHTLQSSDLLHEAFIRLMKQSGTTFENRVHFYAIAARLMRQILVEHARNKHAAKRNGGQRANVDEATLLAVSPEIDVLTLDDALDRLAHLDVQQARIVEMRFFGGLSIEETASELGISTATVKRDWLMARLWLHSRLGKAGRHDS